MNFQLGKLNSGISQHFVLIDDKKKELILFLKFRRNNDDNDVTIINV